jgi:hypothetical protein
MRLSKANFAGLSSPLQQAEMKSILAGAWPPLKPLPVFRYETAEYRATIDFDKKRGEWVCRRISFPSNTIQELRGGLREITLALPHGEAETAGEDTEPQAQELEKDTHRRLQAIQEWKANYESGALYFELLDQLSESQRGEIDDSLRLSLTARQLQFSPKNVAYVFDALSSAGGRFAMLIAFAKRNKAKQGSDQQPNEQAPAPEAERAMGPGEQSQEISSCEAGSVIGNPVVPEQGATERLSDADELPALTIKNVLPEQEPATLAEPISPQSASQPLEMATSEIADADSIALAETPCEEQYRSSALSDFMVEARTSRPFAGGDATSSVQVPALEISAIQVAVFTALFLSAVFAFIVGLTVGRGPMATGLRETSKAILGMDDKSPAPPHLADEPASRTVTPPAATLNDSGNITKAGGTAAPEREAAENPRGAGNFAEGRSAGADSSATMESRLSAKPEALFERNGAIGPIAPSGPAPRKLTPTVGGAPALPRSTTILVTRPGRGSQPFRVSFPEKTIVATSSFAMSSQLSVLVSPAPVPALVHKPARLEAGELVSFAWPRYPRPEDRHGLAQTIRVRATIGQLGQVRDVKFLNGASALLPATKAAMRQWRYRPTLLDKKPVQAQQDVTIEFRPQYSSQPSTGHSPHN